MQTNRSRMNGVYVRDCSCCELASPHYPHPTPAAARAHTHATTALSSCLLHTRVKQIQHSTHAYECGYGNKLRSREFCMHVWTFYDLVLATELSLTFKISRSVPQWLLPASAHAEALSQGTGYWQHTQLYTICHSRHLSTCKESTCTTPHNLSLTELHEGVD